MERSFARSTRYDFDRAQWRGLWRMRIQEYLICAIQNIQALISHVSRANSKVGVMAAKGGNSSINLSSHLSELLMSVALMIATHEVWHQGTLCTVVQERLSYDRNLYLVNSPCRSDPRTVVAFSHIFCHIFILSLGSPHGRMVQ